MERDNQLLVLILLLGMSITILLGCSQKESEKSSNAVKTFKAQVETVRKQAVPQIQVFPGRIRSKVQITLAAKLPGYVKEVPVQIGQEVKRGTLLVAIDDTDIKARIKSLYSMKKATEAELGAIEAKYQYASINYERFKRLFKEESATKDELDRARTAYQALKRQVDALHSKISSIDAQIVEAQNQLSYLRIKAPLAGWVADRAVDPGTYVNPGQPLIKVDGKNVGFWFEADVDDALMNRVSEGDEVIISIPAVGKIIKAKIEHIQKASNKATNTFSLLVDLGNIDGIKSGLFGRVFINLGNEDTILLPESVIVQRGGIQGVYVVDEDNIVHWRIVRLGKKWISQQGRLLPLIQETSIGRKSGTVFVSVLSGLEPDEKIVVTNLIRAKEGERVE